MASSGESQCIPIPGSPSISAQSSPELVDIIVEGILRVERVALPLLLHVPPEQVCVGEPGEVLLRVELSDDDSEPVLLEAGKVRAEAD